MPTIYQARCADCKFESTTFSEGYNAVLLHDPNDAGAIPSPPHNIPEIFIDDRRPHLCVLAHPLESNALEACQISFADAAKQGRLIQVQTALCKDCGKIYERLRLRGYPGPGCLPCLGVGIVSGIALGYFQGAFLGFAAASMAIWVTVFLSENVLGKMIESKVRARFSGRVQWLEANDHCTACGSKSFATPERARSLPCPQCRQKALSVHSVGRS
jgi:hypothetical protein